MKSGTTPDLVLGDDWVTITLLILSNAVVITMLVLLCLAVYFNTNVIIPDEPQDNSAADPNAASETPSSDAGTNETAADENSAEVIQAMSMIKKAKVTASELEGMLKNSLAKRRTSISEAIVVTLC